MNKSGSGEERDVLREHLLPLPLISVVLIQVLDIFSLPFFT